MFYPHSENFAHHYFADHIRLSRDKGHEERLAYLRNIALMKAIHNMDNDATVIISSEAFSLLSPQDIKILRELFPEPRFNVRVVLFHRNFCSWMLSIYQQNLKDYHAPLTYSAFAMHQQRRNISQSTLYVTLFSKYVTAFTKNRVRIVDYDSVLAHHIDVIDALFEAGGVPWTGAMNRTTSLNTGLTTDQILLRQLWRLFDIYTLSAHHCSTLTSRTNKEILRNAQVVSSTVLARYMSEIPRAHVDVSLVKFGASQVDRMIRDRFGDIIVYGNQTTASQSIETCRNTIELRVDDILMNAQGVWVTRFEEQYQSLGNVNMVCI